MLEPGTKARAISLPDQSGNTVKLSGHRGHKVLVYIYPEAFPVCLRGIPASVGFGHDVLAALMTTERHGAVGTTMDVIPRVQPCHERQYVATTRHRPVN